MSKTSFYIGNSLLDFNGAINVKRQVNDYRDTSIGSSNKSYTVNIPLTPGNVAKLKNINDIRSKQEVTDLARIVMNGVEVIRGTLRILNFTSLFAKIIVEADDWIDDVKGMSIRDLSWVGGDEHLFTAANISNSWTAGAGAFYRYPLINFAELYSGEAQADAAVYPYDFYPMWNIEDIVRKIFEDSGYTVAANSFFDGAFGQALYQESAPVVNNDDFIAGKGLAVYVDDITDNRDEDAAVGDGDPFSLTINKVLQIEGEDTDEGGDFNTGTYRYVAPEDGTYRLQAQIKVFSEANDGGANYDVTANSLTWSIRKNGTPLVTFTDSETDPPEPTLFDGQPTFNLDTGWIHLEATDYIDIHVNIGIAGTNESGVPQDIEAYIVNGLANSFLINTWDERNLWPGIGKTISPSAYLPDMDTVAFLQGLKAVCNLRFWMDRANRTIYIETSNDFYGSTPTGSDLNVSNCVNGNYTTFTGGTPSAFIVTSNGSASHYAGTADEIPLINGQKYVIAFDVFRNSGGKPIISIRDQLNGTLRTVEGSFNVEDGSNTFVFTANWTGTGVVEFRNNSVATDYEVSLLSVKNADTVADWSDLIDYSQEPQYEVVASNYNKTQIFRYKPDTTDQAYINFVSDSGIPSEKTLILDSEYAIPGTLIRENPVFSPTIIGQMYQIAHRSQKVPKILGEEEFVSSEKPYPLYRPKKWLPRLFEWKGMVALTTGSWDFYTEIEDTSSTNYTTFPSVETPDMADMFSDYWLKDFRRIDENKIVTCTLKIKPLEIIPFTTVVGAAANEGFRARYKLNLEGIDMYFIMSRITTNGDLVKCEFMQIL